MSDYVNANVDVINDIGADTPERSKTEVWSYARDQKVREAVLERSRGKCEFCGKLGFAKPDGARYLEAHHVSALANDGEDRLTNVIALCPNDHREAHFGERRKQIGRDMMLKLVDGPPLRRR
jgi:predicted restriction endonuclease